MPGNLNCWMRGDEIIVSLPGTDYAVAYFRLPGGFKVIDANGQSLAYFYARENDNVARTAGVTISAAVPTTVSAALPAIPTAISTAVSAISTAISAVSVAITDWRDRRSDFF